MVSIAKVRAEVGQELIAASGDPMAEHGFMDVEDLAESLPQRVRAGADLAYLVATIGVVLYALGAVTTTYGR